MTSTDKDRDFEDQGSLKRGGRVDLNLFQNKILEDGLPGLQLAVRNWVKYYLHEAQMEQDLDLTTKAIINVGNVDGVDVSAIALDNMPTAPSGDIPVNSQQITGLADGVDAQDAQAFGQRYTNTEVESVITAELVDEQSIDNAIDFLISNHQGVSTAHHAATVAGDLNHNDLANIDAGDIKHLTATQVSALHAKQHAITSATDHTSTATSGRILKADANGLPVDATNTDTEVADAVTKKHNESHALDSHTVPTANIAMSSKKFTGLVNGSVAQDSMAFGQKFTPANARSAIGDIFGSDGKADATIDLDAQKIDNATQLVLDEVTAPTNIANHGILFVDSGNYFKYMDENGKLKLLKVLLEYGHFGGGYTSTQINVIEYINTNIIATVNGVDRGDLTISREDLVGVGGEVWGFFAGGLGGGLQDIIDSIDMNVISSVNAVSRGVLTDARTNFAAVGGSRYGHFVGGHDGSGPSSIIDYIDMNIISVVNAVDRGDMLLARFGTCGVSSKNYGFICAGSSGGDSNVIEYIDMNVITAVNGVDRGDLLSARQAPAGVSGDVYGHVTGGGAYTNVIEYFDMNIITAVNAVDRGDLTEAKLSHAGVSGSLYGHLGGGNTGSVSNVIEYIDHSIITAVNAVDRGNLTQAKHLLAGAG